MGAIQLPDWHVAAFVVYLVLEVVSLWPYIEDMLHGSTRPNRVSFVLWTTCQAIAVAAMYKEIGWSFPVVALGLTTMSLALITVLAFSGYGYNKYEKTDGVSFVLSVMAIVGWQTVGEPMVAIFFAIGADVFATIPTIRKSWREPQTEHAGAWGLVALGYFFGVLSSGYEDVADWAMLSYLTAMCTTIFLVVYFRQKRGLVRQQAF